MNAMRRRLRKRLALCHRERSIREALLWEAEVPWDCESVRVPDRTLNEH